MGVNNSKEKYKKLIRAAYAAGLSVFVMVAFVAVLIYGFGADNRLVKTASCIIPYPAAVVDWKFISLYDLENDTNAVKSFYEKQDFSDLGLRVDFSTSDGEKRLAIKRKNILSRLIENKLIEEEAKKRGIVLTEEIIDQEVERKLRDWGSEEYVKKNVLSLYGWTMEDFKEKVVKPDIYREKLFADIRETSQSFKEARQKIEKARKELEDRQNFGEIAGKYSEGESAKNKGDLGWFSYDQMLPEISGVAGKLEKGKISEIVESPLGYHIVMVDDKKTEDDQEKVKIKQIFVRTPNVGDWLSEKEKNAKINVLAKGIFWNKESCEVEFVDDSLKDFENNLINNSKDDISVLF
ncbi:MAG: PpiC protein [Patescibacteria group bacterium]|nr:PpiC protein [Patescibacteria group bacterium]